MRVTQTKRVLLVWFIGFFFIYWFDWPTTIRLLVEGAGWPCCEKRTGVVEEKRISSAMSSTSALISDRMELVACINFSVPEEVVEQRRTVTSQLGLDVICAVFKLNSSCKIRSPWR